jgi:glutaredoxin-like YruB-family protein
MTTQQTSDVTIYSTPTCGYCQKAKNFFSEHGIDYTEHDVSENKEKRQEMVQKSGQMGVPVIIVNDEIIVGFDKNRLTEELKL